MSPFIILASLFWGLICLAVGQNRKQSSITNFLAGAFLGPLGLILVLVSPKKEKTKVVTTEESKLCPHCGKYYQGNPNFCPNCGNKLKD